MARAEKIIFCVLIALLVMGVGVKFYKLRQDKMDFKLTHDVQEMALAPGVHSQAPREPKASALKKKRLAPKIIDINIAYAENFEALPHIGPDLAKKIVDYRAANGPFQKKSDLLKVDGVSLPLYKKIEPYLILQ